MKGEWKMEKIALVFLGVLSLLTLLLYAYDKLVSKLKGWRIPEKCLLLLALLGGGAGGLCGMLLLHHKTRHWYFWVINVAALAVQLAVFVFLKNRVF